MSNPKSFQMPIGAKREIEEVIFYPGFRTEEQFEVVRSIVESSNFDFASCPQGLFTPESADSTYQGPFCFLWYDKSGVLHLTRIGKRGKILRELTPD